MERWEWGAQEIRDTQKSVQGWVHERTEGENQSGPEGRKEGSRMDPGQRTHVAAPPSLK